MKYRSIILSLATLGSFGTFCAPLAHAQTSAQAKSDWTFTGNVGLVSEYRYRGLSQTNFKPAIQGGLDLGHSSGFYIGTWGSSISWLSDTTTGFASEDKVSASMEWDFYGGYKGTINDDLSYDVGGLYYYYPGRYPGNFNSPNTFELYGAFTWKFITAKLSWGLTDLFGTPDSKNALYADVTALYPLSEGFNVVAHVGYQSIPSSDQYGRSRSLGSYADWKLGVTYDWAGATWGLAYVDTNAKSDFYTNYRGKNVGKATAVLSVLKTF